MNYSFENLGAVIAMSVLNLAIGWKLFQKYGQPWWKGIIPFYSDIVEYSVVWERKFGYIVVASTLAGYATSFFDQNMALSIISSVLTVVSLVLNIILGIRKCKGFGRRLWFVAILIISPFLGNTILAFGKSKFEPSGTGPNGLN